MYWSGLFSIRHAQRTVSDRAARARRRSGKRLLAVKTPGRRVPEGVPRRGRMTRRVLNGSVSQKEMRNRVVVCAFLFFLIGGAIALLATGTGIKDGPWTSDGLIIAFSLGILGALVGYFTGKKKPTR